MTPNFTEISGVCVGKLERVGYHAELIVRRLGSDAVTRHRRVTDGQTGQTDARNCYIRIALYMAVLCRRAVKKIVRTCDDSATPPDTKHDHNNTDDDDDDEHYDCH